MVDPAANDMVANDSLQAAQEDSCLAVIVTYNPELIALSQSIDALNQQGCTVLLVDNCSDNVAEIQQLEHATVIANPSNLGLGAAHNQGYALAKQGDYPYLLLLDQDSLPLVI